MFASVDWLSFGFEMDAGQMGMAFSLFERVGRQLERQYPKFYERMVAGHEWTPRTARAPYNASMLRGDHGCTVFAHQMLNHGLVEVGGIGMDTLGGIEAELFLASEVQPRLTRIDIAVDIFCEVRPDEFTAHREGGRFKSWGEQKSESGHTIYVGSRTSDRYARVYRYNEPHPRHQFLRVEHVLKAEQAKLAVGQIRDVGLEAYVAMLGNTFGWKHGIWRVEHETDEAVKAWRPERRAGKTVMWLHGQVIPAIVKLHREGTIDARQLFADHILPELDK